MKPVFAALGDIPNKLAKIGHMLESGRNSSRYTAAVLAEIDLPGNFVYKIVDEYPVEYASWQAYARSVLERSMVAQDLTEEDITAILALGCSDGNLKLCHRRVMEIHNPHKYGIRNLI